MALPENEEEAEPEKLCVCELPLPVLPVLPETEMIAEGLIKSVRRCAAVVPPPVELPANAFNVPEPCVCDGSWDVVRDVPPTVPETEVLTEPLGV